MLHGINIQCRIAFLGMKPIVCICGAIRLCCIWSIWVLYCCGTVGRKGIVTKQE